MGYTGSRKDPDKEAKDMLYVGGDVHKKTLQVCVLDGEGNRVAQSRIANTPEKVISYFGEIAQPASVAIEASHNWGMLCEVLGEMGFETHVCHSREAKLIGLARVSTDKVDAYKLATLLRVGLLPEAYVPDSDGRDLRALVRGRASLVRASTGQKNQIHAILRSNWIEHPYSDLFGKAGRGFLGSLKLEDGYRAVLNAKLKILDGIKEQLAVLDEEIKHRAHIDMRAMILDTAPGFGEFRSVMFLAEVVDINRFRSAESFVCYTGLNPREDSSGERIRRGRITKEGSSWLRWILVEAAHDAVEQDGKIRDLYLRVLAKKGDKVAIVAAARELAVSLYWMLKRMEVYRPSGKKESLVTSEAR